MDFIVLVGFIYEIFVIAITFSFVLLASQKYMEFRNTRTFYLFLVFLSILIGVIFSWSSKLITLWGPIEYVYNNPDVVYPQTPMYWFLLRIVDFRFALAFVAIAAFFTYVFEIYLYEEEFWDTKFIAYIIYTIFTLIFTFTVYERGNTFLDALCFLFLFIQIFVIYVPFMSRVLIEYRSIDDSFLKKKLLSLASMSLNFMLVLLSFFIDRVLVLFGVPHFTFFYFLAWIFQILAIFSAYVGYIKPRRDNS
ncbi:MAG: hypothetical protein EU541_05440 [Promethearchaeota archaeon]|nr:MAG: hypothetical protein EU541_05440 [Candidatus Lokiarchaeota archaeon]